MRCLVAATAAAALISCGADDAPPPPNLLYFVSDTLRADAVDCVRARGRTPHLCDLADRGVAFDAAYAVAPWTLPSVVSMFTGSHPAAYAREGLQREESPTKRNVFYHVPDGETLLAEALRDRGYDVLGFIEGGIQQQTNALQGFEEPPIPDAAEALADLSAVFPDAGRALRGFRFRRLRAALQYLLHRDDRPFFLLVWVRDPHAEYAPPPAQAALLRPQDWDVPRAFDFYMRLGNPNPSKRSGLALNRYTGTMTPREVDLLVELYHLEVRSVDDRLGRVLELLRLEGALDDTVVVFTSDHGEGFGGHGFFQHGNTLFDELLRVPLVMAGPGLPRGVRVGQRVSHVGLVPTLADLLDAQCCAGAQGRSLLPVISGRSRALPVYAGGAQRRAVRDAVVVGDHKLIAHDDGSFELYDLARDPDERSNLAPTRPRLVARLRDRLVAQRDANRQLRQASAEAADTADLEAVRDGTLERLRALGYLE